MSLEINVIGNDSKLNQILNTDYLRKRSHYIEVGPEKIILPGKFEKFYDRITNFEVRDDDVFILAFPKTGSRWAQEMVWLLLNDLDFQTEIATEHWKRAPILELETLFDDFPVEEKYLEMIENLKSPRCIRSHLHWTLLPKALTSVATKSKMIVVLRNPEDTCTSYYHQATIIEDYSGSWEDLCHLFLEGKVPLGPYWKHLMGFWEQRNRPNVMFVKYNNMVTNLPGTIIDVSAFLGVSLSDDEVLKLTEHLSFDNLKKIDSFNMDGFVNSKKGYLNPFMRKGKIGDHKNVMSEELRQAFQKQKEMYLTNTGLSFE